MQAADFGGILFQFTLFALLSYKLYCLFKEYMIPFLYGQIELVRKEQVELLDKEKLLRSTLRRVEGQISYRKKVFVSLEKKVQIWHKVISDNKLGREVECELNLKQILEKRKKQIKNFSESKMILNSVPQIINLAKNELLDLYQGDDGKQLLSDFIVKLKTNRERDFVKN